MFEKEWWNLANRIEIWADAAKLSSTSFSRAAILIAGIGYFLIFNDQLAQYLTFDSLTDNKDDFFVIDQTNKLRFVFFGLWGVSLGRMVYLIRRPFEFSIGASQIEYLSSALRIYTNREYSDLLDKFQHLKSGTQNQTPSNTPSDNTYDKLWNELSRKIDDSSVIVKLEKFITDCSETGVDGRVSWSELKNKNENTLLSVLKINFLLENQQNRYSAYFSILLSALGYLLIFIPSLDLLWAVFRSLWI